MRRQRIFPLAFHVDYWNDLGWRDPFSDPRFSERQRVYAHRVAPHQVYTPQMIVNGAHKFVGSDRVTGAASIARALTQTTDVTLRLSIRPPHASDRIEVTWEVVGSPAQTQLHLALVQWGIVRDIGAGENAGARLHHENVVRAFVTVALTGRDTSIVELPVPHDVERRRAAVIGYVQHSETMRVLGAARIDLR